MTFTDVVVDLIKEWALLDLTQENLYKDVMLENYKNLPTVGKAAIIPALSYWTDIYCVVTELQDRWR